MSYLCEKSRNVDGNSWGFFFINEFTYDFVKYWLVPHSYDVFLVFKHTVLRRDEVVLDTVRALTQQQLVIFTVCLTLLTFPLLHL